MIKFFWDGKSSQAKLINHNYEKEVPNIYLSQSILDYFKSRDLLVKVSDNHYKIDRHYFMLSLNPELWEISQDAPATNFPKTTASVVHSITGTLLVERREGEVKQITCQLKESSY